MFSVKEKQYIADVVEATIRGLKHPEMDNDNIRFTLHVDGKESWSWADIHENSKTSPLIQNPWNEVARDVMKENPHV